mmetsp:Transcript_28465/g.61146  ORF Transcript_28465/g.61146 Transcript_28465/m.61146 type:complete len:254 (+) Transcript_28465:582-1343(+)
MTNIILAEEELTRQVGHFDAIHISHPDLSILTRPRSHQRQPLEILATQRPTSYQENTLICEPRLEVLPHNGNLVIVSRSKERTHVRRALINDQRAFIVMDPLINGGKFARGLDDFLRRRSSQEGAKACQFGSKETSIAFDSLFVQVARFSSHRKAILNILTPARPLDLFACVGNVICQLEDLRSIVRIVQSWPMPGRFVEFQDGGDGEVDVDALSQFPILSTKHLRHGRLLQRFCQREVLFGDGRTDLVKESA